MEILPEKSEKMTFLGRNSVRYQIFMDKKSLQKIKNFKYFGCEITYENDIQQNVATFFKKTRNINNTFKTPLLQRS